jgi:hypothetical protein
MTYDDIVDRVLRWALDVPSVRALWLESNSPAGVRRPYAAIELHLAADEPDFACLLGELPGALESLLGVRLLDIRDAPRFARELELESRGIRGDNMPWTLIVERTSMLAKRRRICVAPLLDKTNHLTHVMDFSGSRPARE